MKLLQAIQSKKDPIISWVLTEDDLCEAVLYRAATIYQIGESPEPKAVFDLGYHGCALLRFSDDSLYCFEFSCYPEVWAQASYFLTENFHLLSEQEKEFLS
ncbi:MAG: hypothetical protein MN733_03695 [Nitrososphaera sp.]|nr:hypothetical protein [Nitrososphaera sp.]